MDDASQAAPSPVPSPAKGKGKKTSARGVRKAKKTAAKKGNRGRGRRSKVYADPRVQAAYERQQDLAALYAEVTKAIKPALEEVADSAIKTLLENPTAHQEVAEYEILQKQLDERLRAAIVAADTALSTNLAVAERTRNLDSEFVHIQFHNQFDYKTEEFFDGALNRTSILAELRREGAPVDTPDFRYGYVQEPNEVALDQGPYRMVRNGIEVPFPSLLEDPKKAIAKVPVARKTKATAKRRAEDQPEGQPDSKKPVVGPGASQGRGGSARDELANAKVENGDDALTPLPRHIGGLLSAEQEADAEPESSAPSPGAVLDDEQTPVSGQKPEIAAAKNDLPDLPNGASEPDARGVRTVFRRGPRANNRIIISPLFEWDDKEIGFRDSANDSTRKATRATRGRFLNKPNSGTWHLDQTIVTYNCLEYGDDDLDPEVVKKHNLHPKYGLFMSDSVNEPEPPSDHVDGTRPVLVVTPNGSTLPASRSVRAKVMDQALEQDARKEKMSKMLNNFCEKEDIDPEDIVTEEMRERDRSALERLAAIVDDEANEEARRRSEEEGEWLRRERANQLLHAAAYLETEADRPVVPPISQRPSRPYDAVRDVFTVSEPPPPMPLSVDTFGLSVLADVAESVSRPTWHPEPPFFGDSSMIDPRLLGVTHQPPAPPNAFLQTALNPTPAFAHIAPAPPPELDLPPRTTTPRNPFSSQGHTKGSPVLPPLRPSRRDKVSIVEAPPPRPPSRSQEFGSPRGMIHTNSGNFYPPAPARPFHQSYSLHEPPPLMPMPLQGPPSMVGPSMAHNQPPPHLASYPILSPPVPGHPQLATVPVQMAPAPIGPPPGPPTGPPLISPPPPTGISRQRGSVSSNGNSAAKYRKIAAAPIPHNRPWPANGSTELRLAHYDHKEAIKDYRANEPPPRSGPTTIRGWNVNNVAKGRNRGSIKKEDSSEERESPRESPNAISPYLNKWNPAEQG
ncbi:hypothetical protein DL766_001461 [Monosporascus sp. MC13-8B]|uniref:Uncharacterized protein n=1 Tax=Monosporascus cannonballus TaxID=155416 RepID=A0ABY0GUP9_9PEZI|nr:hypothetical protein DL762_008962 [Monosporascus cannonballus]RYO80237.1 hypothetical protein DL763_008992 [Monosporascus cannonballus]RYP37581.1 hypothetical protein DL766_001461 [Monosporascus sp. MC13-8B]